MIQLIVLASCYTAIGLLHYDVARRTDMPKHEQLKYSIVWPWLYIATIGCALYDYLFPCD